MSLSSADIAALTPAERLELLERLWDSLTPTPNAVPLTDAHRAELDLRLNDLDSEGPIGVTWDEMLSQVRRRER
jgi:putative addiction module component (TIGR02574 family)